MLSHRSTSIQNIQRSSASYGRQSLSAARVTNLIQNFKDEVSYFPFVPYAVSLSLRVAYRELRTTNVNTLRLRARRDILDNCKILSTFEDIFWSATVMCQMASQTIKEMDRLYNSVIDTEGKESSQRLPQRETKTTNDEAHLVHNHKFFEARNIDPSLNQPDITDFARINVNELTDIDLFASFDPAINLDTVDAVLGDSINLAVPLDFGDWLNYANVGSDLVFAPDLQ
jgi:hypothetical protein